MEEQKHRKTEHYLNGNLPKSPEILDKISGTKVDPETKVRADGKG